ncbi:MAG: GNAT family N-acetyltransferase [Anaerovoracaceae bacterium]|jgi:hypothetical protein
MDIHEMKESEQEQYTQLWQDTFGDSPREIRAFSDHFAGDCQRLVLEDEGRVRAELTRFKMGELVFAGGASSGEGHLPAVVSYAICTDAASRGRGYGSAITAYARDITGDEGGISMLSPAEDSLVDFYQPLDYCSFFYMEERRIEATDILREKSSDYAGPMAVRMDARDYCSLREEFLAGRTHIRLSPATAGFVRICSLDGRGMLCLNGGQAICVCDAYSSDERLLVTELLTRDENGAHEAAAMQMMADLAAYYGRRECIWRMPARSDSESKKLQAMLVPGRNFPAAAGAEAPWFGFPFE